MQFKKRNNLAFLFFIYNHNYHNQQNMKRTFTYLSALILSLFVGLSLNAQTFLTEDFTSTTGTAIPALWLQTTEATDGGFKTGNNTGLSSQYWPIPAATGRIIATNDDACDCIKLNELLSLPAQDFSSASNVYLSMNAFFFGATIGAATETAKVDVSVDNGTTWTTALSLVGAGEWQDLVVDLSAYAGQQSVTIGFRYGDGGGWLYGLALDNIELYVPAALDISLTSNNMTEYVVQGNVPVVGTFYNSGVNAITSLSVSYTVNAGAPVIGTLNGINVPSLTSYNFTHPTNWNATTPGTYQVALSISAPNGGTDASPNDNSATKTVNVATQAVTSLPLVEEFSSNTCPPCASFNAVFIPRLQAMNANMENGSLAVVKYQMDYPSPGTDKSYNADADARHTFYGVPGIPDAFLNGVNFGGSQADLNAAVASTAVMDISVDAVYSGNTVTATATVSPYANFAAGLRLFVAIVDDSYNDAGTNGETEFHFIMRKMMSTSAGISLAAMTPGNNVTQTVTHNAIFGGVTQNSFNFWSADFTGVTVVAWVQNTATGEVFQAAIDASLSVGIGFNSPESIDVTMFPNPAQNNLTIRANMQTTDDLQLNIFNALGQKVGTQGFSTNGVGTQSFNYSTDGLSDGVYMVQLVSGKRTASRTIVIKH